jgi:hypothetical protein
LEANDKGKIAAEIRDLGSRLYYCSNSGEGRKMRRWIERRIRELERKLDEIENAPLTTKELIERQEERDFLNEVA